MDAIVFIILKIFLARTEVLKIGEHHLDIDILAGENSVMDCKNNYWMRFLWYPE